MPVGMNSIPFPRAVLGKQKWNLDDGASLRDEGHTPGSMDGLAHAIPSSGFC